MGHSVDDEYLNRENIEEYLDALANQIKEQRIGNHRILIVGGAAMALKYADGRSTVDVDICFREQNNLYKCCQQVSLQFNLPDDWINADVMHSDSFSYALFENAKLYKTFKNVLEVYIVDDLDLYCMKLVSFRPKDVQDTEALAASLKANGIGAKEVHNNFIRLYGDEYYLLNDDRKLRFMELQFR